MTELGNLAFRDCTALEEAVIGDGLELIENLTFSGCTSLESVYFDGDAPAAGLNAFENTPATVYYREGSSGWDETFGGRPTALFAF